MIEKKNPKKHMIVIFLSQQRLQKRSSEFGGGFFFSVGHLCAEQKHSIFCSLLQLKHKVTGKSTFRSLRLQFLHTCLLFYIVT